MNRARNSSRPENPVFGRRPFPAARRAGSDASRSVP